MDSHTRRQVLAVAAVAGGGIAGCLGSSSSKSRSHSATEGPGRTIPDEQTATDPPTLVRRGDVDQPPIQLTETDDAADRSEIHEYHRRTTLIDSAAMAERLVETDTEGDATDLASFVSATDFDTESLYLEARRIEQCFWLSLCYISWQDNEIRTNYGRVLRPYDERCSADVTVFESRLIRLPVALDADDTNGFGSTVGGGRCRRPRMSTNGSRESQSTEPQQSANTSSASNGSESK